MDATIICIIVNFAKPLVAKDYNIRKYFNNYEELCKEYNIINIKKPYDYTLNYEQEKQIKNVLELLNEALDYYFK